MFAGTVLDLAHGFHRPLVVHVDVGAHAGIGRVDLLVRIEAVIVAAVPARFVVGQLVELEALLQHLLLVDRLGVAGEDRIPVAVLVIDRHVPLGDGHLRAHRNHETVRKQLVGDADMSALPIELPQRDQAQAVFGALDIDDRPIVLTQDLGHRQLAAG